MSDSSPTDNTPRSDPSSLTQRAWGADSPHYHWWITAALMAAVDPRLFFWALGGAYAAIVVYVGYRIVAKDPLPLERQRRWVPFPARASAMAAALIPRPRRRRSAPVGERGHAGDR